jgi:hypothetical protein
MTLAATRSASAIVIIASFMSTMVSISAVQDVRVPITSVSGTGPAMRRRITTRAPMSAGVMRTTYTTSERPCCRHGTVEVDTKEPVVREPRRNIR